MTLQISVRGSAERRYPAERALVSLAVTFEGTDKQQVFTDAVGVQQPLTAQLQDLHDLDAVPTWSSDQVRVSSHRPYSPDGSPQALQHVARIEVRAEFADFEQLGSFLDQWSGRDGVEIADVAWDVTARNRRVYEAEVRKAAVDDAVDKAQSLASAVRKGKVTPQKLADPGLLDSGGSDAAAGLRLAAAPALDVTADVIVIQVEVDAAFTAD